MLAGLALAALSALAAEVKVDWNDVIGPVKPVNAVGLPPMLGGPVSFEMMHYLCDVGIPYARSFAVVFYDTRKHLRAAIDLTGGCE